MANKCMYQICTTTLLTCTITNSLLLTHTCNMTHTHTHMCKIAYVHTHAYGMLMYMYYTLNYSSGYTCTNQVEN